MAEGISDALRQIVYSDEELPIVDTEKYFKRESSNLNVLFIPSLTVASSESNDEKHWVYMKRSQAIMSYADGDMGFYPWTRISNGHDKKLEQWLSYVVFNSARDLFLYSLMGNHCLGAGKSEGKPIPITVIEKGEEIVRNQTVQTCKKSSGWEFPDKKNSDLLHYASSLYGLPKQVLDKMSDDVKAFITRISSNNGWAKKNGVTTAKGVPYVKALLALYSTTNAVKEKFDKYLADLKDTKTDKRGQRQVEKADRIIRANKWVLRYAKCSNTLLSVDPKTGLSIGSSVVPRVRPDKRDWSKEHHTYSMTPHIRIDGTLQKIFIDHMYFLADMRPYVDLEAGKMHELRNKNALIGTSTGISLKRIATRAANKFAKDFQKVYLYGKEERVKIICDTSHLMNQLKQGGPHTCKCLVSKTTDDDTVFNLEILKDPAPKYLDEGSGLVLCHVKLPESDRKVEVLINIYDVRFDDNASPNESIRTAISGGKCPKLCTSRVYVSDPKSIAKVVRSNQGFDGTDACDLELDLELDGSWFQTERELLDEGNDPDSGIVDEFLSGIAKGAPDPDSQGPSGSESNDAGQAGDTAPLQVLDFDFEDVLPEGHATGTGLTENGLSLDAPGDGDDAGSPSDHMLETLHPEKTESSTTSPPESEYSPDVLSDDLSMDMEFDLDDLKKSFHPLDRSHPLDNADAPYGRKGCVEKYFDRVFL